jgi:hypothetical protein
MAECLIYRTQCTRTFGECCHCYLQVVTETNPRNFKSVVYLLAQNNEIVYDVLVLIIFTFKYACL